MSGSDVGPVVPVPLWIVQHQGIPALALRLWMYLYGCQVAGRAVETLTRQTIASGLGCSLDSVDRWARQLVAAEALTIQAASVPGVSGQTNTYHVHLTAPAGRLEGVRVGAVQAAPQSAPQRTELPDAPPETKLTPLSTSRAGAPSRRYSSTKSTQVSTIRSTYLPEKLDPFTRFWKRYPKRVGRAKAILRWEKLQLDDRIDVVLAGLDLWLQVWAAECTEARFIPYPTTWLNARRWEDELEIPVPVPPLSKQTTTMVGATSRFLARHQGDTDGIALTKTHAR
jgi:hypothetical protein|tara:strand:+ start:125 stop:973 length:849 start_codon:yes stop_codon:yes gene_type:complete